MLYIYDQADWPLFRWDEAVLSRPLAALRYAQGRLIGRMEGLGFPLRSEAALQILTQDVIKTSEIEGEHLDLGQVRSSLARRLGLETAGLVPSGRDVDGIVDMLLDATRNYAAPLTEERLFGWHAALFPTGWSGLSRITIGAWRTDRTGPMQIVSGPIGRERVHFQAPPAARVAAEMRDFLAWFETAQTDIDPVIKAVIAHLWFVTIHPFEDGNGRIGRAIADLALARAEASPLRCYSLSARLRIERNDYYQTLEAAQKGDLDITAPLGWFLGVLSKAIEDAATELAAVLRKARFWDEIGRDTVNARQRIMVNRLLDGFIGKLTSAKWAKLTQCSQDTALRDIDSLLQRGILARAPAGGRSTAYVLIPRDAVQDQ